MKRRFYTEEQLITLIDKYTEASERLSVKAGEFHHLADSLRDTCEAHRIPELRARAEQHLNQATWMRGRSRNLGGALAQMRTMPLFEGVQKAGVVVEY
ncbi:MAG TPA: hypothetical protein PKJ00_03305 [Verrucomicrobiota bacterium]|nr:hypothetical protein [Verrucomicrobiota bacterium]HNS69027.1 hypothetical protein [Verrucomicrobiota bacterium]